MSASRMDDSSLAGGEGGKYRARGMGREGWVGRGVNISQEGVWRVVVGDPIGTRQWPLTG